VWTRRREHKAAVRAIADGRSVDWDGLAARAVGGDQRVISALRSLVPSQGRDFHTRPGDGGPNLGWATRTVAGLGILEGALALLAYAFGGAIAPGALSPPLQYPTTVAVFLTTGAVLLFGSRRKREARSLGAFLVLVASAFSAPLFSALWDVAPWLRRGMGAVALDAFLPAVLLSFILALPEMPEFVRPQKVGRSLLLCFWLAGALLAAVNIGLATWQSEPPAILAKFDRRSPLESWYWAVVVTAVLVDVALAVWKFLRTIGQDRERTKWLLLAVVCGSAPTALASAMVASFSPFQAWVTAHQTGIGYIVYVSLLTIPVSTACLVTARRVIEIRLDLLIYSAALASGWLLGIASTVTLAMLAYSQRDRPLGVILREPSYGILLGLVLVAVGVGFSHRRITLLLRGLCFRERPNAEASLTALARVSGAGVSILDVVRAVRGEIGDALRPLRIDMFVWNPTASAYIPVAAGHQRALAASSAVAAIAAEIGEPFPTDLEESRSIARVLPERDQQWLLDLTCRLLVPFPGAGHTPIALAVLGPKASDLRYSIGDRRYLRALAEASGPLFEGHIDGGGLTEGTQPSVAAGTLPGRALECDRCGIVLDDRDECGCGGRLGPCLLPPLLLGKFRIERRIGRGGMGVVYRAQDIALDRPVAIKTLPTLSTVATLRLQREARAMATVSHPNLAVVLGLETWRGTPLLVMEYLHGGTLAARLSTSRLTPEAAFGIGLDLAAALESMHRVGLVHRDVKPSNIGFQRGDVPKLLDFGLAQILRATTPEERVPRQPPRDVVGTPAYLPPEALKRRIAEPTWDLWGLNVTLFEAIAGVNPFRGDTLSETVRRIESVSALELAQLVASHSAPVATYFARALAADPRQRPTSGHALRAELTTTLAAL
jgi:hypothetical protein